MRVGIKKWIYCWYEITSVCFSWVVYEHKQFSGNLFVLSEGDYPNLTSMGCTPGFTIRSVKVVPTVRKHSYKKKHINIYCFFCFFSEPPSLLVQTFSVPSISLFGLECLEGREITVDTEILSMIEEGFNNHILSVRVNRGWWAFVSFQHAARVFSHHRAAFWLFLWGAMSCVFMTRR